MAEAPPNTHPTPYDKSSQVQEELKQGTTVMTEPSGPKPIPATGNRE